MHTLEGHRAKLVARAEWGPTVVKAIVLRSVLDCNMVPVVAGVYSVR